MSGTEDDSSSRQIHEARRAVPYLVVAMECDRPEAGSARYSLEGIDCVEIGRGDARGAVRRSSRGVATLHVTLPAPAMSTRHARLVRAGASWVVEDAGSKNGTDVNGEATPRAVLRDGDLVTMGRVVVIVVSSSMTPIGAPLDVDTAEAPADRHVTLDPALGESLGAVRRVAPSSLPILILGETGTGKEVLAREVHALSRRRGPMVCVNCGAIPATLMESQLFGHVKGAFSGALRDEPGLFRAAQEGTVFLDEIGDLPAASQAALLRVLQEHEVLPVGATRPVRVDFRVVAATHRSIDQLARAGDFRADLLARLDGLTVVLPPLRERSCDVGLLVAALLRKLAGRPGDVRFTPPAARALLRYDWPLNTRELEQCVARALALAGGDVIDVRHLPPSVASPAPAMPPAQLATGLSERDERIRLELLAELARFSGNLADVARAMGKARMQVHRWCRRFGIDPNVYRR